MSELLCDCGPSDAGILLPDSKYWLEYRDGSLVDMCGVELGVHARCCGAYAFDPGVEAVQLPGGWSPSP